MSISLRGRTALVTGVSSGLGEGVARIFARLGATVVGIARRQERGAELAEQIAASGGKMLFVEGDLTDPDARMRVVHKCIDASGRVDILVNNAAVGGSLAMIEDYPPDDWDRTISINLGGVFHMCRLVMPHMKRQKDGAILNISSINARFGVSKMAAYCSAKAGVVHLTKVIATEGVGDNVRANVIILGGVASEMNTETTIALARSASGTNASPSSQRLAAYQEAMMRPEDVAWSLAALCVPEARLITGSEIAIDQAMTAGAMASALIHGSAASLMA